MGYYNREAEMPKQGYNPKQEVMGNKWGKVLLPLCMTKMLVPKLILTVYKCLPIISLSLILQTVQATSSFTFLGFVPANARILEILNFKFLFYYAL